MLLCYKKNGWGHTLYIHTKSVKLGLFLKRVRRVLLDFKMLYYFHLSHYLISPHCITPCNCVCLHWNAYCINKFIYLFLFSCYLVSIIKCLSHTLYVNPTDWLHLICLCITSSWPKHTRIPGHRRRGRQSILHPGTTHTTPSSTSGHSCVWRAWLESDCFWR